MGALYPLTFEPLFKERVWGGRVLGALYGKSLPPDVPIGESWEISDRPGDESVIRNGPLAGRTLRWVMEQHGPELLGGAAPAAGHRFPLLCKILDAREKLSLQVHPPPSIQLGEPKTEMWYVAEADPGAELYVGLKRGVTREEFERQIHAGTVADCFHRIPVHPGDTMFLPSGRVHAIGAGLVILEIQQNSDTTFRVFDWNRVGLDGRARDLHIAESLASIDFSDFEPSLVRSAPARDGAFSISALVRDPLFNTDLVRAESPGDLPLAAPALRVIAVISGPVTVRGTNVSQVLGAGEFCVVPASVPAAAVTAGAGCSFLLVEPGREA